MIQPTATKMLYEVEDLLGVTPVSVVEDYPGRELLAVLPIKLEARLPPYGVITFRFSK